MMALRGCCSQMSVAKAGKVLQELLAGFGVLQNDRRLENFRLVGKRAMVVDFEIVHQFNA